MNSYYLRVRLPRVSLAFNSRVALEGRGYEIHNE